MGSPIRCLDEFDVFMDSVNRKMSIDMLIGAAKQSLGRQFVLISPGTKEDFKKIKDVHVKEYVIRGYSKPIVNANTCGRLAAPERGQTTLSF
jgi:hypothetical protein